MDVEPQVSTYLKISRYIPTEVRRKIWTRDRGQCTYTHPESGRACCAKDFIEFDHIKPFALGGESTEENLRLRCRTHNRLAAEIIFGKDKVQGFCQPRRQA